MRRQDADDHERRLGDTAQGPPLSRLLDLGEATVSELQELANRGLVHQSSAPLWGGGAEPSAFTSKNVNNFQTSRSVVTSTSAGSGDWRNGVAITDQRGAELIKK
jgi:hypothetical protein